MNGASENLDASSPATVRTWQEFPDEDEVARAISTVLFEDGSLPTPVIVTARERNPQISTFGSEIVTCSLADGSEQRFLFKYGVGHETSGFGHRRGVRYEALVYRRLLEPLSVTCPRYYGEWVDPNTGESWLVIEWVEGAKRLNKVPLEIDPLPIAGLWLGAFQAEAESVVDDASLALLIQYDSAYYTGWARRTSAFAGDWKRRLPWLATLCKRFTNCLDALLDAPQTAIHGEFTPKNVILRDGAVYPVDWESAGIGPGEIDLAGITDRFPAADVKRCETAYLEARWQGRPPHDFHRTLEAARLYWCLRWMGNKKEWTQSQKAGTRFEEIRRLGEGLGLI